MKKKYQGTSEKHNFENENAKIRAKTLNDDEGVSKKDTSRRSEAFAAESLHLQSKGCFSEVPQYIAFLALSLIMVITPQSVSAQTGTPALDKLRDATTYNGASIIPNFDMGHPDCQSASPGVINLCSAILYVTDFLKYVVGSIAVFYLFISAFRLITAGDKVDDVTTKEKENFQYVIIGLIIIIMSSSLINNVISSEGGIEFLESISAAENSGQIASQHIQGVYNFLKIFIGAIAVLFILISGVKLLVSAGKDDVLQTQKKHILWALVGIMVIGIAELVVQDIIFGSQKDPGTEIDYSKALRLIADLTNFLASFISFIAILAVIYAGFLYITSRGEEEGVTQAKKILTGVVLGLILTAASYAIINTLIGLQK
ncbi:hypothetical protein HYV57_04230 [Candidatus Peregrinibacteria bacterium]|nr:hypothetical protein [Candidatus Peregrinibacteria bacterium]